MPREGYVLISVEEDVRWLLNLIKLEVQKRLLIKKGTVVKSVKKTSEEVTNSKILRKALLYYAVLELGYLDRVAEKETVREIKETIAKAVKTVKKSLLKQYLEEGEVEEGEKSRNMAE